MLARRLTRRLSVRGGFHGSKENSFSKEEHRLSQASVYPELQGTSFKHRSSSKSSGKRKNT